MRFSAASTSSTLTGRFSIARRMPLRSFSSLKGSRWPLRLTTGHHQLGGFEGR
jgi:hypothetical protein